MPKKFIILRWTCLLFAVLLLTRSSLLAILGNNVRVKDFDWLHVQTDHFDIYYDKQSEALLPRMIHYLEKAWKEVGDTYNYHVPDRTPFFFFSDHNQFEQTNIVSIGEGTGGVTEAFKNRFLIFNDGSETWLRHVIPHEFVHVVQFNIIYGGFWKSIRLLKSPFLPLWMMEGTAEYGAGEIDEAQTDMVVRDAILTNTLIELPELHGFGHLKPNQVTLGYKTGEMAIRFMEEEFGKGKAGELLKLMRDYFDVSSALETLIGCDLDRFNFRFKEWLKDRYDSVQLRAKEPISYGPQLTTSDGIPQFNESPVLARNGKTIYFFSDRDGQMKLYELNRESGISNKIIGSRWSLVENIHTAGRALSISQNGRYLAFTGEKKQRDYLYLYDVKKRKLHRIKTPFDEIRSPVFSPINDDQLLIIGMANGFNDLYLINRRGDIVERLTDTPQNEKEPTFSPNGKHIFFSGEMLTPDLDEPDGYDLFGLNIETKTSTRLTNLIGDEREAEILPNGDILFVRDRNDSGEYGFNINILDFKKSTSTILTDMKGGAFSPRFHDGEIIYVGFYKGEKHLYQMPYDPHHPTEPTSQKNDSGVKDTTPIEEYNLKTFPSFSSIDNNSVSSLIRTPARPYKFSSSTDLFIPFFFYSSLDGFVFANIFQGSDLMGNHQLQQQLQYASKDEFIDLAVFYTYAKHRPNFTVGFLNRQLYEDFDKNEKRTETTGLGILTYPLDRISSLSFTLGIDHDENTYHDSPDQNTFNKNHFWSTGYDWDTVTGRYLVPTEGTRFSVSFQKGTPVLNATEVYNSILTEGVNYLRLPRESTLASRVFYGRSTGSQPQEFRIGGIDRIRAVPRRGDANRKNNIVLLNNEFRVRMSYLDARTKFMFPDFFFKAAYLLVFNDAGVGWNTSNERNAIDMSSVNNTVGVGIAWPTFIMQTFQLQFSVQWAKRTDSGTDLWYITIGPSY